MEALAILRGVESFSDFSGEVLAELGSAAYFTDYSNGQLIVQRSQEVTAVGIVVSGRVEVRTARARPDDAPVMLPQGQLFGEMSLLTGEPAVADVFATSPSRILHVPHAALTAAMSRNPKAAQRLGKLLTKRLLSRVADPAEQEDVARARADSLFGGPISADREKETVLVLNLGSSSIKYALYRNTKRRCSGLVERIGLDGTQIRHDGPAGRVEKKIASKDHADGLQHVLQLIVDPAHGALERLEELQAVGHRTVHGGTRFTEATVVDEEVKAELRRVSVLAPLHNPVNLIGIELCEKMLPPAVPQVAVFDTAFHMTMPEHAYRYAIPTKFADDRMCRRFGFHGTSHKYVSRTAAAFLGMPSSSLRLITCHLGNGASMAAVDHGRCVDTSMGLTPLEGLVMGTRAGDIDAGLVLHLLGSGMTKEQVDKLLNKESGLLGLSGISSDMRELETAADAGMPGALLAIQVFCYRVRKYLGAYLAAMGGLDAVVFTGGIGENGAAVRSRICNGLSCLGISLDEKINREPLAKGAAAKIVSTEQSPVKVLVVPTDEEGMIAAETTRALDRVGLTDVLSARRDKPIPIGVSAHHVHVSREDLETLFGKGHELTPRNELGQPGQFACEEALDLVGPKGRVDKVRILGPVRAKTQVEISRTEEFKLGIDAPIRASGELDGSPGLLLVGPKGQIELKEGVICALRHIHISPENALSYGLRDRDVVRVKIGGERSVIFGDVLVRVHPDYKLEMHIDTDEANAAEIHPGMSCAVESIQRRGR